MVLQTAAWVFVVVWRRLWRPRAFLELSLVFVMGLAFGFTLLWDSGNRFWRRFLVGVVLLAIGYNYGLMWLYFKGYIPRADYLF